MMVIYMMIFKPTFTLIKANAQPHLKIRRTSYFQLLDNLLFEHFDKFQAYIFSVFENVESQFFLEKEFCK